MVARGAFECHAAAGDGRRDDERARLDPVRDDPMLRPTKPLATLDLDRVGRRPADRGPHRHEERDEVVDLRFLGGRADRGATLGERRREHGVLGAHDRHERERDVATAQPPGRLREVVAVAVVDLGAERPHRLDVEVHRSPADPVAARVADDDLAEPREQRPEQDEARAHPRGGFQRHEQPVDVARGDLVDVRAGMVHDDPQLDERLRHDAHVLDLGDVGQPAAFTGERRRREQLEGGILRPADLHRAAEWPATLDPEDLAGDRLRAVLPLERPRVRHQPRPIRGAADPPGGVARRRGSGGAPAAAGPVRH